MHGICLKMVNIHGLEDINCMDETTIHYHMLYPRMPNLDGFSLEPKYTRSAGCRIVKGKLTFSLLVSLSINLHVAFYIAMLSFSL